MAGTGVTVACTITYYHSCDKAMAIALCHREKTSYPSRLLQPNEKCQAIAIDRQSIKTSVYTKRTASFLTIK